MSHGEEREKNPSYGTSLRLNTVGSFSDQFPTITFTATLIIVCESFGGVISTNHTKPSVMTHTHTDRTDFMYINKQGKIISVFTHQNLGVFLLFSSFFKVLNTGMAIECGILTENITGRLNTYFY